MKAILTTAPDAQRLIERGGTTGKIILTMN